MIFQHVITQAEDSRPVLNILKGNLGLSSRLIKKLKKHIGSILLNDIPVFTNVIVKENEVLKVIIDIDEVSEGVIPEEMTLDIIYEDELLIALNKPPHMVIHPTYNHPGGTMANGLAYYFSSRGEKCLIRPVSRLDRDTSGIVIFAKNQYLQDYFSKQKNKNSQPPLVKKYHGIVAGLFDPAEGSIELPIKHLEGSTIERIVAADGDYSLTKYRTLESFNLRQFPFSASLVEFELVTGRTHQIRVHCMYSGHPLIGETLYNRDVKGYWNVGCSDATCSFSGGPASNNPGASFSTGVDSEVTYLHPSLYPSLDLSLGGLINRQCLHSREVSFIHPLTGQELKLVAEIPVDMKNIKTGDGRLCEN